MATTLTATPDPAAGTIRLEIADATGLTGILRSDVNGTRLIRLHTGELPATGPLTLTDYEASLSGRIRYRTQGDTSAPYIWAELGADLPRFTLPLSPSFAVVADTVHGYSAARDSRSTFHTIIGRADPAVTVGKLAPRTGSLDIWFGEYAQARDLENMLGRGTPALYRQAEHPGLDMYFHAANIAVAPDGDSWRLTLNYVEVNSPAGSITTAKDWTFTRLAAEGTSFDAVRTSYTTFDGVTAGQAGT